MYRIPPEEWDQGMSLERYLEGIVNNKPVFLASSRAELLSGFTRRVDEARAVVDRLRTLPAGRIVAIVEDWCTDAFTTLGFWVRFAGELGWELKVFRRDAEPDLMSHFLRNGRARSIPVYAFYTRNLEPLFWFSGRHPKGDHFKEEHLGGRAYDDLSTREKIVFRKALTRYYEEYLFEETILDLLQSLVEHVSNRR